MNFLAPIDVASSYSFGGLPVIGTALRSSYVATTVKLLFFHAKLHGSVAALYEQDRVWAGFRRTQICPKTSPQNDAGLLPTVKMQGLVQAVTSNALRRKNLICRVAGVELNDLLISHVKEAPTKIVH